MLLSALPEPFVAPHGRAWVGYVDGVACGCVLAARVGSRVELRKLYVDPACRGRGVARLLVGLVDAFAVEVSASAVTLTVHEDRLPAKALYATSGYSFETRDADGFERWTRPVQAG